MSFSRYAAYESSGENWIGDIPAHWGTAPVKRLFRLVPGATPSTGEPGYWDGGVPWATPADLSKLDSRFLRETERTISVQGLRSCATTLLPSGSLVLSTRAPIGSVAVASAEVCTNQGCKSLVPGAGISSAFYYYVLRACGAELDARGTGTTFRELSTHALAAFALPFPPKDEQLHIAAFLDRETAKIDELVEEQRRLIALLDEKRQAVISHAVTKGLNPDAPMKASGVEWLDVVPSHWSVNTLSSLSSFVQTGPFGSQLHAHEYVTDGIPVVNPVHLRAGRIVPDGDVTVSGEVAARLSHQQLKVNDIVFARRGELGRCALVTDAEEGWLCGTGSMILRVPPQLEAKFVVRYLSTQLLRQYFESLSIGATMESLSGGTLLSMPVVVPPLGEQQAIVEYCNSRQQEFQHLADDAERAVLLLLERRSALITAAVTGQIDVRALAPTEAP